MNTLFTRTCMIAAAVLLFCIPCAADWLQFRGDSGNGIESGALPVSWNDKENIAWKVELPGRGLSSPVIVDGRVIVTASSGYRQDRLHVLCFSESDGTLLWERQFWATGNPMCHAKSCVAAPSPASDGRRIFALFSTNDIACLDLDGNLLWFRGLALSHPNASNSLGLASSPRVVDDTVVVQIETDAESFASGLDAGSGEALWKIDRPLGVNWTSPVVFGHGKESLVLLQSKLGTAAVHPRTGETQWSFTEGAANIPSSTSSGDLVYLPSSGLTALRPYEGGDTPEIVWRVTRLAPATASPIVHRDRVYTINSAGILACADAQTGDLKWNLRLRGAFSSSPIAVGDYLYVFNEEGLGQVVSLGDTGEIVSENGLDEAILCTPAASDNALYVRSDGHLWKIAGE